MSKIEIGVKARDRLTGLTGMLQSRLEHLSGSVQYFVQPYVEKGDTIPEAYNVDEQQLEFLEPGLSAQLIKPSTFPIEVGNIVEDLVTGWKGHAVTRQTFLNGCVFFLVKTKIDARKKGDEPREMWIPAGQLKVVARGLAKPATKTAPAQRPGGPTTKAVRLC